MGFIKRHRQNCSYKIITSSSRKIIVFASKSFHHILATSNVLAAEVNKPREPVCLRSF